MIIEINDASLECSKGTADVFVEGDNQKAIFKVDSCGVDVLLKERAEAPGVAGRPRNFRSMIQQEPAWEVSGVESIPSSINGYTSAHSSLDPHDSRGTSTRFEVDGVSFSTPDYRHLLFCFEGSGSHNRYVQFSGFCVIASQAQSYRIKFDSREADRFPIYNRFMDWEEVLWRRYGTAAGFFLERQIEGKIEELDARYADSISFCEAGIDWEEEEFDELRGCCASFEDIVKWKGKEFRIGFNYGH